MENRDQPEVSAAELVRLLEHFFLDHPRAALMEDGRLLFEMATAKYSITADHGRCVLHLWSDERNIVRTVIGLEARQERLRIRVRRLGMQRPDCIEVIRDRDQRTPATRTRSRTNYLRLLERLAVRHFHDYTMTGLRTAADLEHSFGPAYARGLLVRGQQCWALIGVNGEETPATIDGVLTLGILWLAYCREHRADKRVCRGLKVLVPAGCAATTRARMAWLNRDLAQWELYELGEGNEDLRLIDTADQGNLKMRLVQAFNPQGALDRARRRKSRFRSTGSTLRASARSLCRARLLVRPDLRSAPEPMKRLCLQRAKICFCIWHSDCSSTGFPAAARAIRCSGCRPKHGCSPL